MITIFFRASNFINLKQDSNLLNQQKGEETEVILTEVVPSFGIEFDGVTTDFEVGYQLFDGAYDDSPQDDYTDHRLNGAIGFQLTRRSRVDLNGHYFKEGLMSETIWKACIGYYIITIMGACHGTGIFLICTRLFPPTWSILTNSTTSLI